MREIKFRAWSKYTEKMIHPSETGWYERVFMGGNGYLQTTSLSGILNREDVVPMQYTGLKDKNGIEIYEGDIVAVFLEDRNENSYKRKSKIVYDNDSACFVLDDVNPQENFGFMKQTPTAYGPVVYYVEAECELEVVGNVYENPELLGDSN